MYRMLSPAQGINSVFFVLEIINFTSLLLPPHQFFWKRSSENIESTGGSSTRPCVCGRGWGWHVDSDSPPCPPSPGDCITQRFHNDILLILATAHCTYFNLHFTSDNIILKCGPHLTREVSPQQPTVYQRLSPPLPLTPHLQIITGPLLSIDRAQ